MSKFRKMLEADDEPKVKMTLGTPEEVPPVKMTLGTPEVVEKDTLVPASFAGKPRLGPEIDLTEDPDKATEKEEGPPDKAEEMAEMHGGEMHGGEMHGGEDSGEALGLESLDPKIIKLLESELGRPHQAALETPPITFDLSKKAPKAVEVQKTEMRFEPMDLTPEARSKKKAMMLKLLNSLGSYGLASKTGGNMGGS